MASIDETGGVSTEQLFRQHAGFVARFLTRLGVPREHLQDAVQQVFLVVHRNGGYRPGVAKPTSYLGNIAFYAAAHYRRRRRSDTTRHADAEVDQVPSETADPARAFQVRQDLERLQLALDQLPESLRTVLLLVDVEGESCVSVAAGLGCPVGTVYFRVHQARQKLQSALRAIDARRRPALATATLEKRSLTTRSVIMLFGLGGFRKSEAGRLLQLAREQGVRELPLDELLARHQQLIQSGVAPPSWAASCLPQATSWVGLIGVGPMLGAALASVALVTAGWFGLGSSFGPASTGSRRVDPMAVVSNAEGPRLAKEVPDPGVTHLSAGDGAAAPREDESGDPARELDGSHSRAPRAAPSASSAAPDGTANVDEPPRGRVSLSRSPATSGSTLEGTSHSRLKESSLWGAVEAAPAPSSESRAPPPHRRTREGSEASDAALGEMRDVALAERLLARDPSRTLEMTRALRERFPDGYFREERAYLEVMALHELGRKQEMHSKADAFLRAYPSGLYSARVRRVSAYE